MNLDELQSVQAKERQSSELQPLRSSFYREAGEFIEALTEERARAVEEAAEPFDAPEVKRLTDDIESATDTVEAIYERRVGKVLTKASIAAGDMPVDAEGLTAEEETLFRDLTDRLQSHRASVLRVLDGEAPATTGRSAPADGREGGSGDAAGSGRDASPPGGDGPPESTGRDDGVPDSSTGRRAADLMGAPDESSTTDDTDAAEPDTVDAADGDDADVGEAAGSDATPDPPPLPRTTVRITADVGEMVGADDRDYDLQAEDVVSLPEPNAEVLLSNDAAERVEDG